jgi:hypothetical protein
VLILFSRDDRITSIALRATPMILGLGGTKSPRNPTSWDLLFYLFASLEQARLRYALKQQSTAQRWIVLAFVGKTEFCKTSYPFIFQYVAVEG